MNNLISIIVPIYNVEPYLHRCVDSILAQTYKNLEIILVDDGSPDNCGAICDEYAAKDNRVKVIHKENGGLSAARNSGIDAATGEYIAFVDSDDYVLPQYIDYLYNAIKINHSDISFCGYQKIDNDDVTPQIPGTFDSYDAITTSGWNCLCNFFSYWCIPNVWNKLFRRKLVERLYFPTASRAEDLYYTYRAISLASNVTGIKNCKLYCYCTRNNSIIKAISQKHIDDELSIRIDTYKNVIHSASPDNEAFARQTMRVLLDFCLSARVNKQLRKCIKRHTASLVDEIFMHYSHSRLEASELLILKHFPLVWTNIQLLKHKFFGMPIYLE